MPSIRLRPLVFRVGRVEVALHLAGVLLFTAIAVLFNLTFLHDTLAHASNVALQGAAVVVMLVLVFITLVHETGHALAFCVQKAYGIRISLRGTGGSCTAIIEHNTPRQVLAQAIAGPAATVVGISILLAVWSICPLPLAWHVAAIAAIIFALGVEAFNVLPLHSQSDGTVALYALVWLIHGQEPDRFTVLYIWRPLALAAIILTFSIYNLIANIVPFDPMMILSVAILIILLSISSLLILAGRFLQGYRVYGSDSNG